ncbi:hypothetical protein WJX72_012255 [[Myrmecia] bisecta]|uniref:Fatty acid hydroxylase domain-containing protein n=1 Tax=[Myrmecia] bisecta TaxID=41462 RepID=A0AAW1P6E1_9CHLO
MLHQVLAVAWELTKRSAISAIASIAVFLVGAGLMHTIGFRQVKRPVFVPNGAGDLFQSICSLAFGSPLLMAFLILNEYKPICQAYVGPIGPTWPAYAWWLLSVPLYLWLWDLVFYCTHLVLHTKPVYDYSHHKHHAFRPPTAYSAIAIDPLETILSGLMPFVIPLFIAPFHLPTVFALNGMAMWVSKAAPLAAP